MPAARDIPAQRPKLATLLHKGVEEGKAEMQLAQLRRLVTAREKAFLHIDVGVKHVGTDTLGWL